MSAASAEVLLDAHVHFHDGFARALFFEAAWRNLLAGEAQLGLAGATAKALMLTESRGADVFGELAGRAGTPPDESPPPASLAADVQRAAASAHSPSGTRQPAAAPWTFEATDEEISLWAVRASDGARILIVAGRQLVTHEGLEVLALGTRRAFADGMGLQEARDAVIDAGGVPVVPWGFGKWWFSRGRLLRGLLAAESPGRWFLGDNAGRPRLSRRPRLFARAAERGVFVLPGSDPLPLAGQERKVGRCGLRLATDLPGSSPASSVLDALRASERQPATFGRYEDLSRFAGNQLAMQLRKRRASGGARSSS